jgi:hypothetical protein
MISQPGDLALDYTDMNIQFLYKTEEPFVPLSPEYCNFISGDFDHLPKLLLRFKMLPFQSPMPSYKKLTSLLCVFVFPDRLKDFHQRTSFAQPYVAFNNFFVTRPSSGRISQAALKDGPIRVFTQKPQIRDYHWLATGKFEVRGGDHRRKGTVK